MLYTSIICDDSEPVLIGMHYGSSRRRFCPVDIRTRISPRAYLSMIACDEEGCRGRLTYQRSRHKKGTAVDATTHTAKLGNTNTALKGIYRVSFSSCTFLVSNRSFHRKPTKHSPPPAWLIRVSLALSTLHDTLFACLNATYPKSILRASDVFFWHAGERG